MQINSKAINLVYMGTPSISAYVLSRLIHDGYNIVGLITNKDKPVGRKAILTPSPCKKVALENGIPIFAPNKIRLEHDFINDIQCDLLLCFAYGQIIPKEVLDWPKYGPLNLHGSLLPKYRGAAPIQRAIIQGETITGVSLMEMVDKMDAGKVFSKIEVNIEPNDNYSSLSEKMAIAALSLVETSLDDYLNGRLIGEEQDESLVSFANKITQEEEHLNLHLEAEDFVNLVRGLSSSPGGYVYLNGKKLKILEAERVKSLASNAPAGTIIKVSKNELLVAVGLGVISPKLVQLEGKKITDIKSFINGNHNLEGQLLY